MTTPLDVRCLSDLCVRSSMVKIRSRVGLTVHGSAQRGLRKFRTSWGHYALRENYVETKLAVVFGPWTPFADAEPEWMKFAVRFGSGEHVVLSES
ncbi:MAG: hypothetical protein AB8G99_25215 [Planctomycetaceae bacterium]